MSVASKVDSGRDALVRMAIVSPNPGQRRRLGQAGTAAGFEVDFPGEATDWTELRAAILVITVAGQDELALLERLRSAGDRPTIITLVDPDSPRLGHAALRAGAHAVVDRCADVHEFLLTVRLAQRGNALLPAGLLHELVSRRPATPATELDHADRELLQGLADGATIQRLARQRHQATRTVERHLQRLYARIGVADRVQAVAKAVQLGLVRIPA